MPGVYKRASDRKRGRDGKYTVWYKGEDGRQHSRVGYTDRAKSLELARHLEIEAMRVRDGTLDPGDRSRRVASLRRPADHAADYRLDLLARGDTPKHARDAHRALVAVLADASVDSVADLSPTRIQQALARLSVARGGQARPASARTKNKVLGFVKAFAAWLADNNRIAEVPRGLSRIEGYNEQADRRRDRRALAPAELEAVYRAAESGAPFEASRGRRSGPRRSVWITGPQRAAVYRLAAGTGFRAEEIRTLTPERFALDGGEPTVTVLAAYAKNGKEAVQPVTPALAAALRPFVAAAEPGAPVFPVPAKTARMLRRDLAAAGVDPGTKTDRVVDFHAIRGSFITNLVRTGANPKLVQTLARHSTITLTMDRYCRATGGEAREALGKSEASSYVDASVATGPAAVLMQ